MTGPRTGSLFTGTGALDLAVMDVYGGEVVWHSQYEPPDKNGKEDANQYAARILQRHWPAVPNLGDITKVDWRQEHEQHGPVDIVCGGFPCGDLSLTGPRAGLVEGTRSGLWAHMAAGIQELQPQLVVIENVEGILSARADRGMGSTDPSVEAAGDNALRALGRVLGDLADIGLDAEWMRIHASDVGAPHKRPRIIILAWSAATHPGGPGLEVRQVPADGKEQPATQRGGRELAGPPVGGRWAAPLAHWARILGRPAPRPVDAQGQLNPAFSEWHMGLPAGWVTDTPPAPGMTAAELRAAQLHALGNGVVHLQAATAIRLLHARATRPAAAAA